MPFDKLRDREKTTGTGSPRVPFDKLRDRERITGFGRSLGRDRKGFVPEHDVP